MKTLPNSSESRTQWYHLPDLSRTHAVVVFFATVIPLSVLLFVGWGKTLENSIARPIAFQFRHWLRRDPPLHPQLKIFAFDDATLDYLKTEELGLDEWGALLSAIAARKPRIIFIDKLFSTPSPQNIYEFKNQLSQLGVPLVVGAFVSPAPRKDRETLPLNSSDHLLENWVSNGVRPESLKLPWLAKESQRKLYPYGPHPDLRQSFSHIGHLNYGTDEWVQPLIVINETQLLPMAPIFVAADRKLNANGLRLNGHLVPLDSSGATLINLASPKIYQAPKAIHSLAYQIQFARNKVPLEDIHPDSVVVLLTSMFTGRPQLAPSPFGPVPTGYLTLSLLSSVLSGQWIAHTQMGFLYIAALALLGIFLAFSLNPRGFWSSWLAGNALISATGILSFSFFGMEQPWIFECIAFSAGSLSCFIIKYRRAEDKVRRLKEALDGHFPEDKMKAILNQRSRLWLNPTSRRVSIMFIDVVGFSLLSENEEPQKVFNELKALLSEITEIIHKHDGIIDKTLGDGILAFFGYDPGNSKAIDIRHAEQALQCAIEIQLGNAKRNVEAFKQNRFIFPLRIGINTAQVFIGDLGNHRRVDLTMIGHGVNMGKRLETVCEPFRITISRETKDLLPQSTLDARSLRLRSVQIKHFAEYIESYECDPFEQDRDLRKDALHAYREFARLRRKQPRFPVKKGAASLSISGIGVGDLINFSKTGFLVELPTYLGRGFHGECTLDTPDGSLKKHLTELRLIPFVCEVRWGDPNADSFIHGLAIKSLSTSQQDLLFETLSQFFGQKEKAA